MDTVLQDLSHAVRQLRRAPAFVSGGVALVVARPEPWVTPGRE